MLRFGGSRAVQGSNEGRTGSGWKQSSQQPPPCLVLRSQTRERARTLIAKVGARTASTQLITVFVVEARTLGEANQKHNKHKKKKKNTQRSTSAIKTNSFSCFIDSKNATWWKPNDNRLEANQPTPHNTS
jgi:hypothetical protein